MSVDARGLLRDGRIDSPYLLIVQQSREDREFMGECLGPDYEVRLASDGFEVLSLVLERKPDLARTRIADEPDLRPALFGVVGADPKRRAA